MERPSFLTLLHRGNPRIYGIVRRLLNQDLRQRVSVHLLECVLKGKRRGLASLRAIA